MRTEKKQLLSNTIMLYIMRFSTYFFGFITVPYQTRVLGKDLYGKVGAAMALMVYFQLLIDFGFILSGTQEIAQNSDDRKKVNVIYSSVQILKLGLMALSVVILLAMVMFSPIYREDAGFYFIYLIGTLINGLVPDFVYRGLQKMKAVTVRLLVSRSLFTVLIFVLLKGPEDYMMVPILSAIGNLLAMLWSVMYLRKNFGVKLVRVTKEDLKARFKLSGTFFLSRIAGTVYSSMNVLLLNYINPAARGYYSVADKLITTGQSALSPISDSVYPYMAKNKDFKLINKILKKLMPPIIIFCTIAFIFASELTAFIFGKEYYEAGIILRYLLPSAVMTLPDYLYGFPTLTALGVPQHANYSIFISSGIHIALLLYFHFTNTLTTLHLAFLVSFTTGIDLVYRYTASKIAYKKYLKKEKNLE